MPPLHWIAYPIIGAIMAALAYLAYNSLGNVSDEIAIGRPGVHFTQASRSNTEYAYTMLRNVRISQQLVGAIRSPAPQQTRAECGALTFEGDRWFYTSSTKAPCTSMFSIEIALNDARTVRYSFTINVVEKLK